MVGSTSMMRASSLFGISSQYDSSRSICCRTGMHCRARWTSSAFSRSATTLLGEIPSSTTDETDTSTSREPARCRK